MAEHGLEVGKGADGSIALIFVFVAVLENVTDLKTIEI
jgi:hypothetical protein